MTLTVDPERQAAFPGQRSANVEIETADGRLFKHFSPTRRGDPDAPLSDGELEEKYRELAEPVLGKAQADSLLASLWAIDTLANSQDLLATQAKAAQ